MLGICSMSSRLMFQVLGSGSLALDHWSSISGGCSCILASGLLALGALFLILGSWFRVLCSWLLVYSFVFGSESVVLDSWSSVLGSSIESWGTGGSQMCYKQK